MVLGMTLNYLFLFNWVIKPNTENQMSDSMFQFIVHHRLGVALAGAFGVWSVIDLTAYVASTTAPVKRVFGIK